MKGTIDVQIKHKDGSIENRREHNVVFDLAADAINTMMKFPVSLSAVSVSIPPLYYWQTFFGTFALSEVPYSLEHPEFNPIAIYTTNSTSQNAYVAPKTVVSSARSIITSATWTIPQAMTLKSIAFIKDWNPLGFANRNSTSEGQTGYLIDYKHRMIYDTYYSYSPYRLRVTDADFAFTGNSFGGLLPANKSDYSSKYAPIAYTLANSTERFMWCDENGTIQFCKEYLSSSDWSQSSTVHIRNIGIYDSETFALKRKFALSQFEGLYLGESSGYAYGIEKLLVINTGTKNWLIGKCSTAPKIRFWQIPDEQSDAMIQSTETTGTAVLNNAFEEIYPSNTAVVGNYLVIRSTDSRAKAFSFDDSLNCGTYTGTFGGDAPVSIQYDSTRGKIIYCDKDSVRSAVTSSYNSSSNNLTTYQVNLRYWNTTAANFSTPIVLAEGDVLTVSYKIEVT